MYSLVDKLIFPAPRSGYTSESLQGHLIYIPKFKGHYFQKNDKQWEEEKCHFNINYNS